MSLYPQQRSNDFDPFWNFNFHSEEVKWDLTFLKEILYTTSARHVEQLEI